MLQLRVPKIYGGGSRCAKHANSRRVWGMPPGKLGVKRLNLEAFSVVLAVNQKPYSTINNLFFFLNTGKIIKETLKQWVERQTLPNPVMKELLPLQKQHCHVVAHQ